VSMIAKKKKRRSKKANPAEQATPAEAPDVVEPAEKINLVAGAALIPIPRPVMGSIRQLSQWCVVIDRRTGEDSPNVLEMAYLPNHTPVERHMARVRAITGATPDGKDRWIIDLGDAVPKIIIRPAKDQAEYHDLKRRARVQDMLAFMTVREKPEGDEMTD